MLNLNPTNCIAKLVLALLIPASIIAEADASPDPNFRYTQLPSYLSDGNFVVKSIADWNSHVRENSNASEIEPPCDFPDEMLVVWQSPTGTSGCSAPEAGIASIDDQADKLVVEFFAGYSSGACQAYYQPVVAACLKATNKPVEISGGSNAYIYIPPSDESPGALLEVEP